MKYNTSPCTLDEDIYNALIECSLGKRFSVEGLSVFDSTKVVENYTLAPIFKEEEKDILASICARLEMC